MSPTEYSKQYQERITSSFADTKRILQAWEKLKEKLQVLLLGRDKETKQEDMTGRLFEYITNLSKVDEW